MAPPLTDRRRRRAIVRVSAFALLASGVAACWLTSSLDGSRDAGGPATRDAGARDVSTAPGKDATSDARPDTSVHDAPSRDALSREATALEAGEDASSDSPDGAVTCTSATTYRASVVASAPIAYWRLGDTSGPTALDEMGHHDGIYSTSGVTFGVHGVDDSGVSLNGSTGKVTVTGDGGFAEFAGNLAYTFEAWIEVSAVTAAYWGVLSNELVTDADKQGYAMYVQAEAGVGFDRYKPGASTPLRASGGLGSWTHIVATYAPDGGSVATLYVNGLQSQQSSGAVALAPGCTFVIGATHCGELGFFSGSVAEVAVYDYALDEPCIAKHYSLGSPK